MKTHPCYPFVTAMCGVFLLLVRIHIVAAGAPSLSSSESTLEFVNASEVVYENDGRAIITVGRTGNLTSRVSIDYATADVTAKSGEDYVALRGTLTFASGVTNQPVLVPIINDGLTELAKSFQILLTNPSSGAALGPKTTTTVRIRDNDRGIQFEVGVYSADEDAGEILVPVIRGWDEDFPTTVDYTTVDGTAKSGEDYVETSGRLEFKAAENRKVIKVPILNDGVKEALKSFRIVLRNAAPPASLGKPASASITIRDNDPGASFARTVYSVMEDAGEAIVEVRRGQDGAAPAFTLDYSTSSGTAVAGLDFQPVFGTLSFAAGERSRSFSVPILNNGTRDAVRAVTLTLSNPSGGIILGTPVTASLRILDNNPGVSFDQRSYLVLRNSGDAKVTVLRGNDYDLRRISVDYSTAELTAKAGQDFQSVSGTLTFQANETVKTLTIPVSKGTGTGGTNAFRIILTNPTAGAVLGLASATVTLIDLRVKDGTFHKISPPLNPALAIATSRPGLNLLDWNGPGILQRADSVLGPWQTLSDRLAPLTLAGTAQAGFYRVVHPRPANLLVPSSYDGRKLLPLVVLLHGYGSDGVSYQEYVRFAPLVEQKEFLYCFPDGTLDGSGAGFWNGTDACCDFLGANPDDSGYLRGLINEIASHFAVDRKRISLMGQSNGGFMAYRMACEHADLIAAVASRAGMTFLQPERCAPTRPVNVLHIHGTADETVAYDGGFLGVAAGYPADSPPFPGAIQTVELWAKYNGGQNPVTETERTLDLDLAVPGRDTVVTRYTSSPPGGAVELWTILGAAHRPTLFSGNSASEFSERVIDWLLTHPKP